MRFGVIGENLIERLMLVAGLAPTPLLDTYALGLSRIIMVATKVGIFETLADGPLTAAEVASRSDLDARATEKLLNALVGIRYLRLSGGRYALALVARRWLLAEGRLSLRDNILQRFIEWEWLEGLEDFVRQGRPLDVHATMSDADWALYQRGMRSQARFLAPEFARRAPVPKGATALLDIGGSHGHFSAVLCRRHPALRATVLDLPAAVAQAAPLLAREGLGDRLQHRAGDALTDDLGTEGYDVILVFSLVHHFDAATNRDLVARAARALRPGGALVIGDAVRPPDPRRAGPVGTFFDLYFALTSQAGTWTAEEMADWQRQAGLRPRKPIRLLTAPGVVLQAATKRDR